MVFWLVVSNMWIIFHFIWVVILPIDDNPIIHSFQDGARPSSIYCLSARLISTDLLQVISLSEGVSVYVLYRFTLPPWNQGYIDVIIYVLSMCANEASYILLKLNLERLCPMIDNWHFFIRMQLPHVHGDVRNKTIAAQMSLRENSAEVWQKSLWSGSEDGSEALSLSSDRIKRWHCICQNWYIPYLNLAIFQNPSILGKAPERARILSTPVAWMQHGSRCTLLGNCGPKGGFFCGTSW